VSPRQVNGFPSLVFKGGLFIAALISCAALTAPQAKAVELPEDDAPPTPSETTTTCEEGFVWDADTQSCIDVEQVDGDQAALYGLARELAWAGRMDDALIVLGAMKESDRQLTYIGFVARRLGDWPRADTAYQAAIARNPNNLLARSYYGQGLVERGDREAARFQLTEIRRRGGRISWPELALRLSLDSGRSTY